uniref:Uncharacterized protein n=1 Tax=Melanthalia intermedia TaxID=172989 RepID=A0A345UAP5_9FLOR|nr:hypothetical protein [Melanthalia intermedia]AXI97531.1 hypothetical protein [Melanthalia intermedia]
MKEKKLLDQLQGKWISQKTNYFIKNKSMKFNQSQIQLSKIATTISDKDIDKTTNCYSRSYEFYDIHSKQRACYLFCKQTSEKHGSIQKITRTKTKYYTFTTYAKDCLKIEYISRDLTYEEYIHFIKPKFKIIISILKRENKYVAISFISEIKTGE